MNYHIEPVTSDIVQREEIARFLSNFEGDTDGPDVWRLRLTFWWEQNPFYAQGLPKGWILRKDNQIAGFLGAIATDYIYNGKTYKALNATTWRVLDTDRTQSMSLFLEFFKHKNNYILFDTTPNDTVEKVLRFLEFNANTKISNIIFPLNHSKRNDIFNLAVNLWQHVNYFFLPKGNCRIVDINSDVKLQPAPDRYKEFPVKDKNYEYLRWLCNKNPSRKVIGYFNKNDELSSFVVTEPAFVKKHNVLQVIDYFIGDDNGTEVLSIINYITKINQKLAVDNQPNFLILTIFLSNAITVKKPFFIPSKNSSARLYYILPDELKRSEMLNYISDGDFVLF